MEQDVARLQISMDNLVSMKKFQSQQHVPEKPFSVYCRESSTWGIERIKFFGRGRGAVKDVRKTWAHWLGDKARMSTVRTFEHKRV